MKKIRSTAAVFALFAFFTATSWAGDMGMPPLDDPAPEPTPTSTQIAPPEDGSTLSIFGVIAEAITSLI